MTDNVYKIVLLGKIADGFDPEIAYNQLSTIFNIDIKKIPKLLKKPVIIRTHLKRDAALRYQTGLEKIGILCDITPPLDSPAVTPSIMLEDSDNSISDDIEPLSLLDIKTQKTLIINGENLRVINLKMPFSSMIIFLIKSLFAALITLIIYGGITYLIWLFLGEQISDFVQHYLPHFMGEAI
jgi:hypothetical protein